MQLAAPMDSRQHGAASLGVHLGLVASWPFWTAHCIARAAAGDDMTELRNIIRQPDGALALRADEPAIAFCVSVACRACRRRIQEPRREAEPWPSRRGSMSTVRGTSDNPASHFIDEVHTRA